MIGTRDQVQPRDTTSARRRRSVGSYAKSVGRALTHLIPGPVTSIIIAGLAIECVLLGRLWMQLHTRAVTGWREEVLDVSDLLVSPFRSLDGSIALKQTGILDFATLAAIEGYLVAALVLIFLVVAGRIIWHDLALMCGHKQTPVMREDAPVKA